MSCLNETFEFTLEQLSFGAFFTLPERADDRLVVGLWLIPAIYGTFANILLIATVLRSKDLRSNPSYYLLTHIAFCNLAIPQFEIFYRLVGIVFRQAYLISNYSPLTISFGLQFTWWIFVFELTLTAINRFVCIFFVGRYDGLFTRRSMLGAVVVTSIAGVVMCVPHMRHVRSAHASLLPRRLQHFFRLFDEWTSAYYPSSTWYIQFDYVVTLTTIGIIIVCYLGVGWRLREKKAVASGGKGRDQLRIALQVGAMCSIYVFNSVLWNIIPYIAASKWVNAAFTSTNSIQAGLHPTIAFVFNSQIRKALLGGSKQQLRASVVTVSSTASTKSR
ncbi:hypothetical protein PRIPAC_80447 [Pristionchus pacificus]|uniref:G protein-coupled receptor n=1 Tax=Pristionchus pacificus TaxID=54126 RepID=A0A2A6CMR3_PRIPA|nr:hypothetical protein PRIPAC_80447 [Pristionchus pacificus]|eukprot:PDM79377.1 G protein-coupled receptor [Pristionchus pacificus]